MKQRHRYLIAIILAIGLNSPAFADISSYQCPDGPGPGERQVGEDVFENGAYRIPVCVSTGQESEPEERSSSQTPMGSFLSVLNSFVRNNSSSKVANTTTTSKKVDEPPSLYKDAEGAWHLSDTRANQGGCAVAYTTGTDFAAYIGPVAGHSEAFIMFGGSSIPPIAKETQKRMTLTTSDGQEQSVLAFHAPNPQSKKSGLILFKLTDIKAAMDEISDIENLKIAIDNKAAFAMKWRGGFIARKAMNACLAN